MAEKETLQRKSAEQEGEQQSGKTMSPPAFQLMAGDDGGAGSGGGGAAGAPIQKQDDKTAKPEKKADQGGTYDTHEHADAIVTVPKGAKGPLPILVVYGGKSYATKEWMKTQVPPSLFSKYIISFSNFGTYYVKGVKPQIEAAMTKFGAKGYYKALLGFSAGGYRIEGAKGDEKWEFLGMIDPVVTNGATYPCPIYMVWTNWDGVDNDARKKLDARVQKGDVKGQSIGFGSVKNHPKMPEEWFKNYGNLL